MAAVSIRNVRKVYPGDVEAVVGFSLDVSDREFIVLVGPSGCGKTTMLRMIAGLEDITEGEISIGGRLVNDVPPKDRDIAMVFQNYAIYPHMTVYDNMAFGLRQRRFPRKEIDQRVRSAAAVLGIDGLLKRKPKALSGGQRQRVAVGRAIVRQPAAFLFDEPLSNLDAKMRTEMRKELKLLHQRLQATIIYVTHDQVEAMTLGERICVMRDGRIEQLGPPVAVYDRPRTRFVAGFIGTPPMSFIPGVVRRDGDGVRFEAEHFAYRLPGRFTGALRAWEGKPVELGVRPEDLLPGDGRPKGERIPARVLVVEALGNELLVYLESGKQALICRRDSHVRLGPGDEHPVAPRPDKVHLFSIETGANVLAE